MIVSRDALSTASPVILAVPCTTSRPDRRLYPNQVRIHAPEGGLEVDAVARGEQVRALAKSRLGRRHGVLAPQTMAQLDCALLIALDLPG